MDKSVLKRLKNQIRSRSSSRNSSSTSQVTGNHCFEKYCSEKYLIRKYILALLDTTSIASTSTQHVTSEIQAVFDSDDSISEPEETARRIRNNEKFGKKLFEDVDLETKSFFKKISKTNFLCLRCNQVKIY
jgi:hypothetical protein